MASLTAASGRGTGSSAGGLAASPHPTLSSPSCPQLIQGQAPPLLLSSSAGPGEGGSASIHRKRKWQEGASPGPGRGVSLQLLLALPEAAGQEPLFYQCCRNRPGLPLPFRHPDIKRAGKAAPLP